MARLDDAVRRILRIKFRAGLFDNPYVDPAKAEAAQELPDARAAARKAAGRSMVLLENDGKVLPLDPSQEDRRDRPAGRQRQGHGRPVVGPRRRLQEGHRARGHPRPEPGRHVRRGLQGLRAGAAGLRRVQDCPRPDFCEAVAAANAADQVVLAVGESRAHSGEAASRTVLDLPGNQEQLIKAIKATGKPFVVVLFNGRPLTLDGSPGPLRRSSRRGSAAWKPATRSPTSCSARSTRAASCPCRSRAASARCRSTTTTSRRAVRATPRRSTTRATATSRAATRSTCSATGSATASSRCATCGCRPRRSTPTGRSTRRWTSRTSPARPVTRWCSSTSTTPWRASRSRCAGCAGSSA